MTITSSLNKPVGCKRCGQSGYLGRMGLYELLEGTPEIKRLVVKTALVEEIQEQAMQERYDYFKTGWH